MSLYYKIILHFRPNSPCTERSFLQRNYWLIMIALTFIGQACNAPELSDNTEKKIRTRISSETESTCVPEASVSRHGRALSLKALLKELEKPDGSKQIHVINQFVGITRLTGFLIDQENEDVILFGITDSDKPPMLFEDFVVALKNVRNDYIIESDSGRYYEYPGCSIDPTEDTNLKLEKIGKKMSSINDPLGNQRLLNEWNTVCQSPQNVRVMGVPKNSHFAKIMVDTDYHLKKIVNGEDSLSIPGFLSLTSRRINQATQGASSSTGMSMSRFWFYPKTVAFAQDRDITAFCDCGVQLLTEKEFLSNTGKRTGTGKAGVLASEFAADFTVHYKEIADLRARYYELENLFRFFAIAKALNQQGTAAPNFVIDVIDKIKALYTISTIVVDKKVPGISSSKLFKYSENEYITFPSCGGVGIEMDLEKRNFHSDGSGLLPGLSIAIIRSRDSTNDSLIWNY